MAGPPLKAITIATAASAAPASAALGSQPQPRRRLRSRRGASAASPRCIASMRERRASGAETDAGRGGDRRRGLPRWRSSAAASAGSLSSRASSAACSAGVEASVGVGGERRLVGLGQGWVSVIGRSKTKTPDGAGIFHRYADIPMERDALLSGTVHPGGREPAPGRLALVQMLVNTVDREHGPDLLDDVEGLGEWLAARGLLEPGAAPDAARPRPRRASCARRCAR